MTRAVDTATEAQPPSIHVRVALTWLAIFPLVSLGLLALAPFSSSWSPILSSLILTLVVVPASVYVVVPFFLRVYAAALRRLRRRG